MNRWKEILEQPKLGKKAYKECEPELRQELEKLGREDIMIAVGGVIPPQDYEELFARGASAIFGPGTVISSAAKHLLLELSERLGFKLETTEV